MHAPDSGTEHRHVPGILLLPAPLSARACTGHIDRFGPTLIDGWISNPADPSAHPVINIVENGEVVGTITANIWRHDLAEVRQGDGRWGFTCLPPKRLADGHEHIVTLALPSGEPLLPGLIRTRFAPGADAAELPLLRPPAFEPDPIGRERPTKAPDISNGGVLFSFIVVFYNMKREAARTLHALTRAYQRGIGNIGYEVICIDNGSAEPLDEAWIKGFGPEFRLVRPEKPLPSPVALMNAAAREARGAYVALMIDGAHILSPGVFRQTAEAVAEAPGAAVALRQWFVGGDQRFLSRSGWSREQEDMLFDRIGWPNDPYGLFRISTPVWESPNHWFDGMSETNCLFVSAEIFARVGGFDEAFDEPGAGYANLDLFRRVFEATEEPLIALIGEASFHQFHGGTTTNVEDDEKERLVRGYAHKYALLRGKPWKPIHSTSIRLRGQLHTRTALVARQRPLSPACVGVTDDIRRADMAVHFDRAAKDYLVSVYAEAGLHDRAAWRGERLGVAPPDAFAIASILHEFRPARIVAVHLPPGLLRLLRDLAELEGGSGRFVIVGEGGIGGAGANPLDGEVKSEVRRQLGAATEVVVLYGAQPPDGNLLQGLHAYAPFVSLRSYLIVVGSAIGQPWLGYSRAWTMKAINSFADVAPFAIDLTRTQHLITSCPLGFLQRIGPIEAGDSGSGISLVGVS